MLKRNHDKVTACLSKIFGSTVFKPISILVLITVGVYWNSLSAPFIFDDQLAIEENLSIRDLSSIGRVLSPKQNAGQHTGNRPLLNLSFAINYAIGGLSVRGYHIFNLAIHILNGLLLYGIARRTFQQGDLAPRFGADASTLSFAIALLWLAHPLQTASVTFISQRAESFAAFFYLLTLYCLVRAVTASTGGAGWSVLSIVICFLGMAAKETMATAPFIFFLYDRTFFGGSFIQTWLRRRTLYTGLAGSWLMLAYLLSYGRANRGGAAGFDSGVSSWTYAVTQCEALIHYLRLGLWPTPLVLDYGKGLAPSLFSVWPQALLLLILLSATAYALVRRPVLGFLGAWYFIIIAPSSSFVPLVTQTWAEHRPYLPLAAEVTLLVFGIRAVLRAKMWHFAISSIAVVFGLLTITRNEDYRTARAIWSDTAAKQPSNPRAFLALGTISMKEGQTAEAIAHFRRAVQLEPNLSRAHAALGDALLTANQTDEGLRACRRAVELSPGSAAMRYQLGDALKRTGQLTQSLEQYELAVRLLPNDSVAHGKLGTALLLNGRLSEAIIHLEQAVGMDPDLTEVRSNLATAMLEAGRLEDARSHYQRVLISTPHDPDVYYLLGLVLEKLNRRDDALVQYEQSLRLDPTQSDAISRIQRLRNLPQSTDDHSPPTIGTNRTDP